MDPHAVAPIASETTNASPKTPQAPGLRASRSGHVRGAVVSLAALATAASSGCGGALPGGAASSTSASTPADAAGLVGNLAPEFNVTTVSGARGSLSLKQLRGKVVLLDFWGTFCTPCKSSFPKLQQLNAKYAGAGLQVLGISEDEPEDKGKIPTFATTYGARFAIGWDEDRSISDRYKPETMPSSFLIDKRGVVRFAHVGYRGGDEVQIEKEVQELLAR